MNYLTDTQVVCEHLHMNDQILTTEFKSRPDEVFEECPDCGAFRELKPIEVIEPDKSSSMIVISSKEDDPYQGANDFYMYQHNTEVEQSTGMFATKYEHVMDIPFAHNPNNSVSDMTKLWKHNINIIGKDYMFNEKDEAFIPLRKYFNEACKTFWLKYTPGKTDDIIDKNFKALSKTKIKGADTNYFFDIMYEVLLTEFRHNFTVDSSNKYLYNSSDWDRETDYRGKSFVGNRRWKAGDYMNSDEASSLVVAEKSKKAEKSFITPDLEEKMNYLFYTDSWMEDIFARTFWVYGFYTRGLKKEDIRFNDSISDTLSLFGTSTKEVWYNEKDLSQ